MSPHVDICLCHKVYSEFRLPKYPSLTSHITEYTQGSDPDHSLGPHWQQPGRSILTNHLREVPDPRDVLGAESSFTDLDRIFFTGSYPCSMIGIPFALLTQFGCSIGSYYPDLPAPQTLPVILRSNTTWNSLLGYLDSFSSLHTYLELHPEDAQREDGNIAVRFWRSLMERAAQIDGKAEMKGEDEITVEWPVALVLAKKLA